MSSATPMPSKTIFDSAQTCLELFRVCLAAEAALFALHPYQQRYWAWANSLKVFAKHHISLDAQLKSSEFDRLRQAILLILDVLRDNLNLALKISQNEALEDSQSAASASVPASPSATQHPLKVPLSGIEGSLKRLDRIAVIILQATESSLSRRILAYAEQARDEPYEEHVDRVLLYRFQQALPAELCKLIRNSILHRYYRIQYERDHRVQEAPRWEQPQQAPKLIAERPAGLSKRPGTSNEDQPQELTEQIEETRSEAKTTPLTVDENVVKEKLKEGLSLPPSRRNVDTASVSETGDALYPKAPDIEVGQTKGTCPICLKDYEVDIFEGLKWRAHVDADIQPYICISEDCSNNLRFFADRRSWSSHMQRAHTALWIKYLHNDRVWKCALPHANEAIFSTEEELFEKHMHTDHSDLAVATLRNMARNGGVPKLRQLDKCPICGDEHRPQMRMGDEHESHDKESESDDETAPGQVIKSPAKPSVRFALSEEQAKPTTHAVVEETAGPQSPETVTHRRMERYIGKHLKALAFYFARNLIAEEDDERTSAARARSMDSLESMDLEDIRDPPKLPPESHPKPVWDATMEDRTNGEAILAKLRSLTAVNQSYEYLGVNSPDISTIITWYKTYGKHELELHMSRIEEGRSFNRLDLMTEKFLYYLNEDPDWEPSAKNNPHGEERVWLQRVCISGLKAPLQEDVEVWSGIAPNIAYALAADILLVLEICSRRNGSVDLETLEMDRAFATIYQMIDRRLATIETPTGGGRWDGTSDHTKALKKFATDLADIAEELGTKRSMWLEMDNGSDGQSDQFKKKTGAKDQYTKKIDVRISAVKDGLLLHLALASLATRAAAYQAYSPDGSFKWYVHERSVIYAFFHAVTPDHIDKVVSVQVDNIIRTLEGKSDLNFTPDALVPTASPLSADILKFVKSRLSYSYQGSRFESIAESDENTYHWVFQEGELVNWLREGSGAFWISGKPGSGKSTLMKYLAINENTQAALSVWAKGQRFQIATAFVWNSGTHEQKTIAGLARSLTGQVLDQHPELVRVVFPFTTGTNSDWRPNFPTDRQLIGAFRTLLTARFAFKLVIFIDGLDELEGDTSELLDLLSSITEGSNANPDVKLVISSRPWNIFEDAFARSSRLMMQNLTQNDISIYVRDRLTKSSSDKSISYMQIDRLANDIVERASGNFLWATLVARSIAEGLENGDTMLSLRMRLDATPDDMEGFFTQMLDSIEPFYRERANLLFGFLRACADYPFGEPTLNGAKTTALTVLDLSFIFDADGMNLLPLIRSTDTKPFTSEDMQSNFKKTERRLQSYSKGLLEVANLRLDRKRNAEVRYMHSNIEDFVARVRDIPQPLQILRVLLSATVLRIKRFTPEFETESLQSLVGRAMQFSRYLRFPHVAIPADVDVLDELDHSITSHIDLTQSQAPESFWSMFFSDIPKQTPWQDNFLSFAIVYGLTYYVQRKLDRAKGSMLAKPGRPLLDCACIPISIDPFWVQNIDYQIARRLIGLGANPNTPFDGLSTWQRLIPLRTQMGDKLWLTMLNALMTGNEEPDALSAILIVETGLVYQFSARAMLESCNFSDSKDQEEAESLLSYLKGEGADSIERVSLPAISDLDALEAADEAWESSTEDTSFEGRIPPRRSTSRPNRFLINDNVHKFSTEGGVFTKGVFKVRSVRLHQSGAYYEYQLANEDGRLFKDGQWVREKDLKVSG